MKTIVLVIAAALLAFTASAQKAVRIGANVVAANLIKKVAPVYPPEMKSEHKEGSVVLQVSISKEGVPQSMSLQSGDSEPAFVDAAIAAVKEWRYKPVLLNGEPVEVLTTVTVNFTLSQ